MQRTRQAGNVLAGLTLVLSCDVTSCNGQNALCLLEKAEGQITEELTENAGLSPDQRSGL